MSSWQDLFSELRKLYGSTSELLSDAERLLASVDYCIAHGRGKQIGIERSGDISQPDWWAPHWVARFFYHEKKGLEEAPLVYVACVLSDGGAMDYTLPGEGEPVVTAGIMRCKPGAEKQFAWYYWNAKYWMFGDKTKWPNLEWTTLQSDRLASQSVEKLETFGVPLIQVQKRVDLQEKVIGPLIERAGIRNAVAVDDVEAGTGH